jgi:uncharacterized membrane protein (UPF0127 family)
MKTHTMIIIIIVAILLIVIGVFFLWHIVLSQNANPPLKQGKVSIGNTTFMVELATTTLEKTRGLSYRASLAEGTGMLFTFNPGIQNFWMKDMNFPIDIIWIAGGKVAGFVQDAEPQPGAQLWALTIYSSPDGVDKVLEVNAGVVAKDGIKVGDGVTIGPGTE